LEGTVTRILVVDDHATWRRFVSSTLQKQQELRVIGEVSDGLEAIQKAQELQPDLILLDIGLPTLNGIEAARRIRELCPTSKILFLTENRSSDIAKAALSTGASGYIVKSDAGSALLPGVEAVVQGKEFVSASLADNDLKDPPNEHIVDQSYGKAVSAPLSRQNLDHGRRHEIAFYPNNTSLLEGFARFAKSALTTGNPVIAAVNVLEQEDILLRLRADAAVDVDAAIQRGTYVRLDLLEVRSTFMINGLPDPVRFARVAGHLIEQAVKAPQREHPRVAICGKCAASLLSEGNEAAAIRLERLCDEIARSYPVDILCGYPSSAFSSKGSGPILERICAEHSTVHGRERV
jgi:DNA-binding NarL/FixJ family response regulator